MKWPAYRFVSPWSLNQMFRDAYNTLCRANLPRSLSGAAVNVGGISPKLNLRTGNSQLTQLHLARQFADKLGMPYDAYIRFCFDFAGRRKRDFIPRPNQLAPSPLAQEAWFSQLHASWSDEHVWIRTVAQPDMDGYDLRNDLGLPAQSGFRDGLLKLAWPCVTNTTSFYGLTILERGWLRHEDLAVTNPEIWRRAQESAEYDQKAGFFLPAPHTPLRNEDLRQSCFGVPGIDIATTDICSVCPARQVCELFRQNIVTQVRRLHNHADPATEAKLRKNRERVQRHRSKKKTELALLSSTVS